MIKHETLANRKVNMINQLIYWILSELGLLYAGAVSVPLSIKLEEANDLLFRLRHADVVAIFLSRNQLRF